MRTLGYASISGDSLLQRKVEFFFVIITLSQIESFPKSILIIYNFYHLLLNALTIGLSIRCMNHEKIIVPTIDVTINCPDGKLGR